MAHQDISLGLEFSITPDLQACLTEGMDANFSFIVSPIVHPRFSRHYCTNADRERGFTRSDMVLAPQDWTTRIVGRLSPHLNVDAISPIARQRHEDCLNEELTYCKGLGLPGIMLNLHGENSSNLARILLQYYECSFHTSLTWVQVPMVCRRSLRTLSPDCEEEEDPAWNETWLWWSKFHERLEWDKRVGVVLELSADVPPEAVVQRWLGEPVKAVVVSTALFHCNKKGYPVLSRPHQALLTRLVEREAQVVVSGARRHELAHYAQYLQRVWAKRPHLADDPMHSYARGWEDYLQVPLQPLSDNLDTHTYNVFEKDPVKYDQYQKAIIQALNHVNTKRENQKNTADLTKLKLDQGDNAKKDDSDESNVKEDSQAVTVMVLGAGRGPLVRATLNAADVTHTKVKVIAVEKNPAAVVVLAAQARSVWRARDVRVVPGDMRRLRLAPPADVIVSELLGSWGDNELSPECLDGAAPLLAAGGVCIPRAYSSHAAPVCSPRLWAAARAAPAPSPAAAAAPRDRNLETLWVVYMHNKHDIAEAKPVFTFEHPARGACDERGQPRSDWRGLPATDNRRCATVTWRARQDNVMHGFGGYFDCRLFGEEAISIVPATHTPGMISWFPVFIPIKTPLRVRRGEEISATFWRCVDSRRVWYEWIAQVGDRTTPMHNISGKSSEMLL